MMMLLMVLISISTSVYGMEQNRWAGYPKLNTCDNCELIKEEAREKTKEEYDRGFQYGYRAKEKEIVDTFQNTDMQISNLDDAVKKNPKVVLTGITGLLLTAMLNNPFTKILLLGPVVSVGVCSTACGTLPKNNLALFLELLLGASLTAQILLAKANK